MGISTVNSASLPAATPMPASGSRAGVEPVGNRVLIVDDQPDIRRLCRIALVPDGFACDEVGTGPDAVAAAANPFDLVLLDVDLPGFNGDEVLRRLRRNPPVPHLKVIMFSGTSSGDDLSRILLAGADDFLTKPFSIMQLRARVKVAVRLKAAQDRADQLNQQLLAVNAELENTLQARDGELIHARNGLVLALAKLVEHRSTETGAHLMRLQRYCRVLAEAVAATVPAFAPMIDANFVRNLEDCAPLHDIGKAALPDAVLNKPGPLTPEERLAMQAHTTIGAETLREVARRHPFATGFLRMAIDIARSHHERWDGTGYPDRLAGEQIPLAARILAIADVYDALRAKRVYKPERTHLDTVNTITAASPGHFDPALLTAFVKCADRFDRIFREFEQ